MVKKHNNIVLWSIHSIKEVQYKSNARLTKIHINN